MPYTEHDWEQVTRPLRTGRGSDDFLSNRLTWTGRMLKLLHERLAGEQATIDRTKAQLRDVEFDALNVMLEAVYGPKTLGRCRFWGKRCGNMAEASSFSRR